MNKKEMMSIITASNDAEVILNEKRESQFVLAQEARAKLDEEITEFLREFFPLEIWQVISKLPNIGKLSCKEKYSEALDYKVKANGIYVGFEGSTCDYWNLYFIQEDGMEILIRITNPNHFRFNGYNPKLVSGHTWWKRLEYCTFVEATEKCIKSIRDYTQMLDEIKSSIGEIYEEIAKANAQRLTAKANSIANNDINLGTETKKRVITITIEEV